MLQICITNVANILHDRHNIKHQALKSLQSTFLAKAILTLCPRMKFINYFPDDIANISQWIEDCRNLFIATVNSATSGNITQLATRFTVNNLTKVNISKSHIILLIYKNVLKILI